MSAGRRISAIGLVIVGAGALALAYVQQRRQASPRDAGGSATVEGAPAVRFEVIDSRPIEEDGIPKALDLLPLFGDAPRAKLPDRAPAGNIYHVATTGDDADDGSPARPWRGLARALARLEPGDRLTIGPGTYQGPFEIASRSSDGTAEHPIEVYASDDATLVAGADSSTPVLTVARGYWHLEGLEISVGPAGAPAIRFAAGAHNVVLAAAHVFGSAGDGIHVGPGSVEVTIHDSHVHHLGSARPVASDQRSLAGGPAGVRIFPGTRGVRITDCRIHNVSGEAVRVVTPEEHLAAGGERLAAAIDLVVDPEELQSGQEEW